MKPARPKPYLKIGDVARLVGVSPSVIRSWESLGLTRPHRTASKYRLYSAEDVKLLKRARFLRKVRGLNAPAIVQLLKRDGQVRSMRRTAPPSAIGTRACASCVSARGLSLAQVAKAVGISLGFLSALERSHMSASVSHAAQAGALLQNQHPRFFRSRGIQHPFGVVPTSARYWRPGPAYAWNCSPGATPSWSRTCSASLRRPAAASRTTHEGEEFLYILQGELQISLEGEEYQLQPGDSFYFESATPHQLEKSRPQRDLGAVGQHAAYLLARALRI